MLQRRGRASADGLTGSGTSSPGPGEPSHPLPVQSAPPLGHSGPLSPRPVPAQLCPEPSPLREAGASLSSWLQTLLFP